MAEKRKLPARERREPAAKKRVSEASTPQSRKKKAPTPQAPPSPPPEPEKPLPTKIKDGEDLPVVRALQPTSLSDKEYQSIAESAVLLASLERSKKKWLSDGILVRYYTKPKKTKREELAGKNPPKESMVKVGPCDVTVGPHLFDAMIYTVKDPNAPPPIQYAPPQRPMVHYGPPNNFQQYQPYPNFPHASQSYQQKRPPQYSPAPGRPPQGYPGNNPPMPPQQQRGPHQAHHAPSPQSGQRPPQAQKGQPAQPSKPSPDPVIQMLATRAAADPELKALMRVVASSQASQEQLRAFQAHIDELNAIIKEREQQEQRQQAASGTPTQPQQQATPAPQNKPLPPQPLPQSKPETEAKTSPQEQISQQSPPGAQNQTPSKASESQPGPQAPQAATAGSKTQGPLQPPPQPQTLAQTPANQRSTSSGPSVIEQESVNTGPHNAHATPSEPSRPAVSTPSATPGPVSTPASDAGSKQQSPAVQPPPPPGNLQQPAPRPGPPYPPYRQQPYGAPPIQSRPPQYSPSGPYYRPPGPPPPPNYKSVVFEFTSPLTPYGSSTSGHAGSGDRYLFPEYSILEWLPNENTVLASFLIVRKVDPNAPFPIEPASDASNSRKGKSASKSKKGDKKGKAAEKDKDSTDALAPNQAAPSTATETLRMSASSETSDKKPDTKPDTATPDKAATPSDANLKEYWQPVTFRIHAANPKVLEPLGRVVKPADEVCKYMNEVMDRAERAPDGFLALRLPREEADPADLEDARGTPVSGAYAGGRSRPSLRGKAGEEKSEVENQTKDLEDEEEEDLKDFYDMPDGLPPL